VADPEDTAAVPPPPDAAPAPPVDVRRSARRRRTVSAYRDGDTTVVLLPARMSRTEERRWVAEMVARLEAKERRTRPSDADLLARAQELSRRHLGGRARPRSVRWVDNQGARWGSCTPDDAALRISSRLRGMPSWVLDYVLVHELAHLLVPGHGRDFWDLVAVYPRTERARGYLEGVAAASGAQPPPGEDADPVDDGALREDAPAAPADTAATAAPAATAT
jgi:predicted metal-dependent hydrolase